MGIPPGELLNPCLILIYEDIVDQRIDFAIAPKFNAAIVISVDGERTSKMTRGFRRTSSRSSAKTGLPHTIVRSG
jgi:hypothetical protein